MTVHAMVLMHSVYVCIHWKCRTWNELGSSGECQGQSVTVLWCHSCVSYVGVVYTGHSVLRKCTWPCLTNQNRPSLLVIWQVYLVNCLSWQCRNIRRDRIYLTRQCNSMSAQYHTVWQQLKCNEICSNICHSNNNNNNNIIPCNVI